MLSREELQKRLPPDCRTDAANKHVEAIVTFHQATKRTPKATSLAYSSFLSGWDAAMELRSEEILEEHMTLHGKILDMELKCTEEPTHD